MRWAGAFALVGLGCVIALLLLELILQAGAAFTAARRDDPVAESRRSGVRIAMLGDSNTYGLFVERDQAYPQRLEARWNSAQSGTRIEVVNLGYPGMNSSTLRNRFLDVVQIHRPDVVTIMVGVNDTWTASELVNLEASAGFVQRLKRASRVYQLFLLLRYGRGYLPGFAMEGRWAPAPRPPEDWEPTLRENLKLVSRQAQEVGVQAILLTYPSSGLMYNATNRIVRKLAVRFRIPLIDLTPSFDGECAGGRPCALLFADQHPTAQGHELAARRIEEELREDGGLLAPPGELP